MDMDAHRLVVDVKEAAQMLSLSPWTIRRYITDGRIKAIRIGRRVLVEPQELVSLVATAREEGAANSGR